MRHLGSESYVCYTYAAITIDRVLFIKRGTQLLLVPVVYLVCLTDWLVVGVDSHKLISTISHPLYSMLS